jgi:hypothetical protein
MYPLKPLVSFILSEVGNCYCCLLKSVRFCTQSFRFRTISGYLIGLNSNIWSHHIYHGPDVLYKAKIIPGVSLFLHVQNLRVQPNAGNYEQPMRGYLLYRKELYVPRAFHEEVMCLGTHWKSESGDLDYVRQSIRVCGRSRRRGELNKSISEGRANWETSTFSVQR